MLREENGEKTAYGILTEAYKQHEQSLVKQMLSVKGLSFAWLDILIPLIHEIVDIIRPGICYTMLSFMLSLTKIILKTKTMMLSNWT